MRLRNDPYYFHSLHFLHFLRYHSCFRIDRQAVNRFSTLRFPLRFHLI